MDLDYLPIDLETYQSWNIEAEWLDMMRNSIQQGIVDSILENPGNNGAGFDLNAPYYDAPPTTDIATPRHCMYIDRPLYPWEDLATWCQASTRNSCSTVPPFPDHYTAIDMMMATKQPACSQTSPTQSDLSDEPSHRAMPAMPTMPDNAACTIALCGSAQADIAWSYLSVDGATQSVPQSADFQDRSTAHVRSPSVLRSNGTVPINVGCSDIAMSHPQHQLHGLADIVEMDMPGPGTSLVCGQDDISDAKQIGDTFLPAVAQSLGLSTASTLQGSPIQESQRRVHTLPMPVLTQSKVHHRSVPRKLVKKSRRNPARCRVSGSSSDRVVEQAVSHAVQADDRLFAPAQEFVNYTIQDSDKILSGVAKSGGLKTRMKRDAEALRYWWSFSHAVVEAVQDARGGSDILTAI